MQTLKKGFKITRYHHYPGIAGPFNPKKGGVKVNLLRWVIFTLIKLNNKIEVWRGYVAV